MSIDTFGIISTIIDYQVISWYTYYMKKPALYIETTIAGYVTGKKSKDVVIRAHQHITLLWWKNFRQNYALFTSDVVVGESGRGDPYARKEKGWLFCRKFPGSDLKRRRKLTLSILLFPYTIQWIIFLHGTAHIWPMNFSRED